MEACNRASSSFFAKISITFTERRLIAMTYKQIEASRELRLWIGQVIVPAITMSAVVLANPDVRRAAAEKIESVKQKFQAQKVRVL